MHSGGHFCWGRPNYMPPYPKDVFQLLITTPLVVNLLSAAEIYSDCYSFDEYLIGVIPIKIDNKIVSLNTSLLSTNKEGVVEN